MSFQKYRDDVEKLLAKGRRLLFAMYFETNPELKEKAEKEELAKLPKMSSEYQPWYSEALTCVSQLLPDRTDDFVSYYKPLKPRKELTAENYTIGDLQ